MSSQNSSILEEHLPPGDLSDLTPENRKAWSDDFVSYWMDNEIAGKEQGREPLSQFFNGCKTPFDQSQKPATITWTAFPKQISLQTSGRVPERWKLADSSRNVQDEYLEWSVFRDPPDTGNIISVTYTCEAHQPSTLIDLYRDLNSDFKQYFKSDHSDFFIVDRKDPDDTSKWQYDKTNIWNSTTTTGTIAHLAQINNTLGAEIDIAAQATVIRKNSSGAVITDEDELIRCSLYGNPDRNSDPRIGSIINGFARGNKAITVAEPVALYMTQFNTSSLKLDVYGTTTHMELIPKGTFQWQRGDISKSQGLRLKVKIPDGILGQGSKNKDRQLTVSDIWDTKSKHYIRYGSQLADYITMGVSAVTINCPADEPKECIAQTSKKQHVPHLAKSTVMTHFRGVNGILWRR
ncbi:MAG: hypothetical protein Q9166_007709 [cf. Caloplaca sp. 2 TL-2023]